MPLDLSGVPEIPLEDRLYKFSPPVLAFKRMVDNRPSCSVPFLEKLGAYVGGDWAKQAKPNFRGWFWALEGRFGINNAMAMPSSADWDDIGYCGIWRGRTASKTHLIYCAIPSMNHGEVLPGESIDSGETFVRIGWKQDEIDSYVRDGYEIMLQMIAEHGEYKEGE